MTVAEETEAHVVLPNISPEAQAELGKYIELYPGLVLRASTYRHYPYANVGCHLLGRLSRVNKEDLRADANVGVDELRQYLPNDLIGRGGVEARSPSRCSAVAAAASSASTTARSATSRTAAAATCGWRSTSSSSSRSRRCSRPSRCAARRAPGDGADARAAVVIDVATGGVRALASYPDYDLNAFDQLFPLLNNADNLDKPLLNRATQSQLEPGSTVKPMVGLAAIAQGLIGPADGIECTGYLVINGRHQRRGRCWVASKFHDTLCHDGPGGTPCTTIPCPWVAHHKLGTARTTPGSSRSPTGWSSCNVYFETMADKLGLDGLSDWYGRFGLGRPTGIGIAENAGLLPDSYRDQHRAFAAWTAGIGQGQVAATPLQMANVAATLARNGVWARPRLTEDPAVKVPGADTLDPDSVDLRLPPAALAAARDGMIRVVNSPAGTGTLLQRRDVLLAGKTGTAQAASLSYVIRDAAGRAVLDEKGDERRALVQLSTKENPNPRVPWYRGTGAGNKEKNHAWFIGFAPAENPRIAFAVLLEYGGSGGLAAAGVAKGVIEACVEHGYLPLTHQTVPPATAPAPQAAAGAELLHAVGR